MPSAIDVVLGQRVQRIRAGKGMSQGDLSRRLGRTQTAVSYWETGTRSMGFDNLELVAAALGVSPADIYLSGADAGSYERGYTDGLKAARQALDRMAESGTGMATTTGTFSGSEEGSDVR